MNISSSFVMYHATKAADIALAEGTYLALQARGIRNIQVHALCPAFLKTEIHESEKHKAPRHQSQDPYYGSEEYLAARIHAAKGIAHGIDLDYVGTAVFTALEEDKFYIFTHPEAPQGLVDRCRHILNGEKPVSA